MVFVLANQMDERLNQVVINLAETVVGETQQVQACRGFRLALLFVGSVELDQRGVVFAALIGDSGYRQKAVGKPV